MRRGGLRMRATEKIARLAGRWRSPALTTFFTARTSGRNRKGPAEVFISDWVPEGVTGDSRTGGRETVNPAARFEHRGLRPSLRERKTGRRTARRVAVRSEGATLRLAARVHC